MRPDLARSPGSPPPRRSPPLGRGAACRAPRAPPKDPAHAALPGREGCGRRRPVARGRGEVPPGRRDPLRSQGPHRAGRRRGEAGSPRRGPGRLPAGSRGGRRQDPDRRAQTANSALEALRPRVPRLLFSRPDALAGATSRSTAPPPTPTMAPSSSTPGTTPSSRRPTKGTFRITVSPGATSASSPSPWARPPAPPRRAPAPSHRCRQGGHRPAAHRRDRPRSGRRPRGRRRGPLRRRLIGIHPV